MSTNGQLIAHLLSRANDPDFGPMSTLLREAAAALSAADNEAEAEPKQEPVAWKVVTWNTKTDRKFLTRPEAIDYITMNDRDGHWYIEPAYREQPAAPAVPSDVERDAARYRWMRVRNEAAHMDDPVGPYAVAGGFSAIPLSSDELDQAIDAAMLAAAPEVKP